MCRVTRTPSALPEVLLRWTMRIRRVLVPDIAEEVDPIRAPQQRGGYRVNGRIAPALFVQVQIFSFSHLVFLGSTRETVTVPRSRSHQCDRGSRSRLSRRRHAKSPYPQSQSCSKLVDWPRRSSAPAPLIVGDERKMDVQWQRLYSAPLSSDKKFIALLCATYWGCSFTKSERGRKQTHRSVCRG